MDESEPATAPSQLVWSSYYAEGWALYAEKMMREQGFFEDPRAELCFLDARIFRAARIIVDTGLHIGDLDFEGAVEIMRHVGEPAGARRPCGGGSAVLRLAHPGAFVS